jgi:hypothetical protein
MTVYDHQLYIGTSWGCLIIAEAYSMRPIRVFRPYSEEVQAIIPITEPFVNPVTDPNKSPSRFSNSSSIDKIDDVGERSFIVTLGKGYRRLLDRYVGNKRSPVNDEEENDDSRTTFALLWRPDSWLSD